MLFETDDSTGVYWFIDVYRHTINWLLYKIVIILFKLVRIPLEMIISMVRQLQYGCFKICNTIQCWILWNYSLIWMNIVTVCHTCISCNIVGYIYIIGIILDAIHSNCIHKLYIHDSGGYKSDQNRIIGDTLNKNSTIMFVIVHYYKLVSNVHKMDQLRQMVNEIHNLQCNCYMGVILSLVDALHSISRHKLNTNGSDGYELNRNRIIQYTLIESISTMFTSIQNDKFCTNIYKMNHFNQIDNAMHNFDPIMAIMNVIDTIAHPIKILIAIYVIICEASFIFAYGTFRLVPVFKFMINHSNTTHLSALYLTTNNMDNGKVLTSIINAIITLTLQTNVMGIHELHTKKNNVCKLNKRRNIWRVFKRNKFLIPSIVKHYNKFTFNFDSSLNIYQTNEFNKIGTQFISICSCECNWNTL